MTYTDTWHGYTPNQAQYRRIIAGLFAAGFATFAQLYSSQSVLPQISQTEGITADVAALSISAATAGLGISVLGWAALADRFGRVRIMECSAIVAALLGLVTPFAPTWELLLALRAVEGLALGALPALSIAYLAEEIHHKYVAVAAGTFISGNTVGGMTGRILSGIIGEQFGWRQGMVAVAIMCALAAVAFVIIVPKSRGFVPVRERIREGEQIVPWARRLSANLTKPKLWVVYAVAFVIMGCFVSMYSYLSYRLEHAPFNVPTTIVSFLFITYLVGTFSSRRAGTLVMRIGAAKVLTLGIGLMIVGATVTLIPNPITTIFGLAVFTYGTFTVTPVLNTLTAAVATIGKAQASALYQFFYYSGSSFLGWWCGVVFDRIGWTATIGWMWAMLLVSGIVGWFTFRTLDVQK